MKKSGLGLTGLLKEYKHDVPSGLVVFLVALPLCLGIALASGAPLFSGILTGIIAGCVTAVISGSKYSVSGPAAGLTVIVLNAITGLGSFESFLLAVVLAGALQVLMGTLKAGIIGLYFPSSVIKGMLAAIGIILILKQIPHLFGDDLKAMTDINFNRADGRDTWDEFVYALGHIHKGAIMVGLLSIGIMLFWDKILTPRFLGLRFLPSALVAVIVSVLINAFFLSGTSIVIESEHLVSLPDFGSLGLKGLILLPDFSAILDLQVWKVAVVIALIASLETLLSLEAVDKLSPDKSNAPKNRELLAQGIGNMMAGLLGGLPMTAVIVRSSTNIHAGARTKMSAIYHGVLLLTTVLTIPAILGLIPLATLAAILLIVGFKLTMPALYASQWKLGWRHFVPFVGTVIAILLTDLLVGIIIGMVLSTLLLRPNIRKAFHYHEEDQPLTGKKRILLRLSEKISFLNKAGLKRALDDIPEQSEVVIDASGTRDIDPDAVALIRDFTRRASDKDIKTKVINTRELELC